MGAYYRGLLFSLFLLLAISNNGFADTPVSGAITTDTTWTLAASPYIVTGNVLVNIGVTLSIEPGVTVKFNSNALLEIYGTLLARGTSSNNIIFTSNQAVPAAGDWRGIIFMGLETTYDENGNYTGGSILEYAVVEYAGTNYSRSNGAIDIVNTNPFINHCIIRDSAIGGIFANPSGTLKIFNSTIDNNLNDGILLFSDSSDYTAIISNNTITRSGNNGIQTDMGRCVITISNNIISNNIGSGIWSDSGSITITDNTISNNNISGGSAGGIYIYDNHGQTTALISNNTISNTNNRGMIISLWHSGGTGTVSNNTISNNTTNHIGGGIYADGAVSILNNTIDSNNAGVGGGIWFCSATSGVISGNRISNNTALDSGGIAMGGLVLVSNNIISGNMVSNNPYSSYGGGIFAQNLTTGSAILNNVIMNNTVEGYEGAFGAGIYIYDYDDLPIIPKTIIPISGNIISNNIAAIASNSPYSSYGGGIYALHSAAAFSHNTIINNTASYAAGVISYYNSSYSPAPTFLSNTITGNFATGTSPTYSVGGSNYSLNYNNIFGNIATYELFNSTGHNLPDDVNAENNWWGTSVESEIQAKIYDWYDDTKRGIVDYSPYETAIRTDAPISPPTGLTATSGTGTITLNWNANPESDTAGYKVYYDTDSDYPYANVVDVGNITSYTIQNLTPDTPYHVMVTAYDTSYNPANDDPETIVNENQTNGNESWHAAVCVPPDPDIPVLISPNNGATGVYVTPTLNWGDSSGAISYDVQVCNDQDCKSIGYIRRFHDSQWKVYPALNEKTTYWWRARANNACKSGEWSDIWRFTTICTTPSTFSYISPYNGATNQPIDVGLDWGDSSGAISYDVYFGTSSNPPFVGNTTSSYYDPGILNYGTTYYWKIVAKNSCGNISGSVRSFTTVCPVPDIPSMNTPLNNTIGVPIAPTLDWDDVSGSTSYRVQVCSGSSCSSVARSANVTDSQWTVTPALDPNKTYYWRVMANTSCGSSSWTGTWSFTTGTPGTQQSTMTLIAPNGGESWQAGTTQTINWSYAGNPGGNVKIQLYKAGVLNKTIISSTPIGSSGSGSYDWMIPLKQTPGKDYKIKVTSTANSACKDTSNRNFTIIAPLIVSSPKEGESWQAGATQTISWTYAGNPGGNVKIQLYKAGVLNKTIISSTPIGSSGSGSYDWTIPLNQARGKDYKIKVTSTTNSSYKDASNGNFIVSR